MANIYFYKNIDNVGMVDKFNKCITLARDGYVAFLYDDDLFELEYLG